MHNIIVPMKFRSRLGKKIYREAMNIQHEGLKRECQVPEFKSLLENENYVYKVHYQGDSTDVIGISWIDKRLGAFYEQKQVKVLSKDVTFGVFDQNSGFSKLSTICSLTADHKVDPLCFSVLLSETEEFFTKEIQFFKQQYSWLHFEEEPTTWFVDGDKGNISAIERIIPLSTVTLCLYHFAGIYIHLHIHTYIYIHLLCTLYTVCAICTMYTLS